jgi:secreted PhoX family phosphatase
MTFKWEKFAMGGEPVEGGAGFANPDNVAIDSKGNVWMMTDTSTDKQNRAVPSRVDQSGKPLAQSQLSGMFGNNSMWFIPTSGPRTGDAHLFAIGPMDCELTGPFFSRDERTLFLSVQHPGEHNGVRRDFASESRAFALKTTAGGNFMQTREVPLGSNWPGRRPNDPPRPAVVAIRRRDRRRITGG